VSQVSAISGSDWVWIFAPTKIEDIVMCANGDDAWAIGIGPGAFDDAAMFKMTGMNSGSPSVDAASLIGFADPGLGGPFPAGMGPRGFPGLAIDLECSAGYYPNFFGDSVIKVDLATGALVWPTSFDADPDTGLFTDEQRVITTPVDVKLNFPSEDRVLVSSSDGAIVVLDDSDGAELSNFATGGVGAGGLIVAGNAWAATIQNSRDIGCVDLQAGTSTTISRLEINPFMGVATADTKTIYVSNTGSNSVSVVSGNGCAKSVTATIAVGNAPRHLAMSPDNAFVYVSNSTDNTVSVIDTSSNSVVETIAVTAAGEPAPIGVMAVSTNNRYLYVFWEGGPKGTPGAFQIIGFDVCKLYSQNQCD
jgi:YVTN family beta-propeller protein